MGYFIYESNSRFSRFFIKDLFTNELVPCSESDFDDLVISYRNLYTMEYDGPNAQVFMMNGIVEARRERG